MMQQNYQSIESGEGSNGHADVDIEGSDQSLRYRSLIFGGLDGIIASMTIISAAIGGNLPVNQVVVIGIACAVANGLAVGMGEYLSSKAHKKYVQAQRRREQYDYKNCRDEGIQYLVSLFKRKGMTQGDAELVVNKMSQYENLFVSFMITEGKGLLIPEDTEFELCTDSGTMFLSFAIFGSIPILSIYLCTVSELNSTVSYTIALGITVLFLLIFGLIKSTFCVVKTFMMGLQPLGIGFCCGTIAYCVGILLSTVEGSADSPQDR